MIVGRSSFDSVIKQLEQHDFLSLDCETTGLRPYHGDRIFSIIIGYKKVDATGATRTFEACYFNFYPSYEGFPAENVLTKEHMQRLQPLLADPNRTWYIHKFNFDMHMLHVEGLEFGGKIWCTLTQGRVEYNEHFDYALDASLERIGLKKDDRVDEWITEYKAYTKVQIPGKKQEITNKHYEKVPPGIIIPYGEDDARGCFALGEHQRESITQQAKLYPHNVLSIKNASDIEMRLAKTVYRMESVGVKIDRAYCERAIKYEADRVEKASAAFKRATNRTYSASPKLFAEVFSSDKPKWVYTDKGNPSFSSDALKTFDNPAAKELLVLRDAKSKLDFYYGFLWHADRDDVVHAQFKPGGTRTFRFTSSEPNLQNMTSEEATYCNDCKEWFEEDTNVCPECGGINVKHPEFMVRRAIVPRPGFILVMPDYDQMEYKMMLDYAMTMMIAHLQKRGVPWTQDNFQVAMRVRDGYDVHKATAELMGVKRKYAKTLNFLLIYGGRVVRLCAALLNPTISEAALWALYKDWKGFPRHRWEPVESKLFAELTDQQKGYNLELLVQSEKLIKQYFAAVPYVEHMVTRITEVIKERGWIRNWAGYRYVFPDRGFAYTGPNTTIQGGCAAVNKVAMNLIDDYLQEKKSRMVLTIHDELPTEVHESEAHEVPRKLKELMESVYPHKHVHLTAGVEWSEKSLADKHKGFPV
jgi:DNA polymerase I-like protein with 3'-5' exonuclease and polymerase domains